MNMKTFNTSGPCNEAEHYMLNAERRLKEVEALIEQRQFFVIHAARQSGKTTYLMDLTRRLNAEGRYYALYCSLEGLEKITEPEKGIPQIVEKLRNTLHFSTIPNKDEFAKNANLGAFASVLSRELSSFCISLDKPLVILFDEADCMSEGTLITFLRQIRDGYNSRSLVPFVHSLALVGMRNIRDYKTQVRPDEESSGSASPFNIVKKSLTLKNFTKEEIIDLYNQHTNESGQIFENDAIDYIFEQTQGQPWLVNAVASQIIEDRLHNDYTQAVTKDLAKSVVNTIILGRDVHIASLLERLKEARVRRVLEPLIMGQTIDTQSDDFIYTCELGLIRQRGRIIEPSNPIYGEVIVRTLTASMQSRLTQEEYKCEMPRYFHNGRIDMDMLMADFQQFWRKNSAIWLKMTDYEEAAPHLVLMAFLQKVVNGGGHISRELAAGRGRIDLCLDYEGHDYPIELKIRRDTQTIDEGLSQIAGYMDICGCTEGWLVVFDRRTRTKWSDKIFIKKKVIDNKTVTVVGV